MLLKRQTGVSPQTPMAVSLDNNIGQSVPISAEVVPLYFFSGGVPTADAGQVAGTVVVGTLTYKGVGSFLGDTVGTDKDTSLVVTSTALTTEIVYPFDFVEGVDGESLEAQALQATQYLENGEYVVDYRKGRVYGKKADASTSLTVDYNVVFQALPPSGTTSNVNLSEVGGSPFTLGQSTMAGSLPVTIASDQSSIPVVQGSDSTIIDGAGTLAAAATPQQVVVASTPCNGVIVQNLGTAVMLVGNVTSQNLQIFPGSSVPYNVDDVNKVYIQGSIGEAYAYGGTF